MTETTKGHLAFLLVSERPKAPWGLALQQALLALGELQIVPEEKAIEVIAENHYDAIIVDVGAVRDEISLTSRLRENQTDLRIIVFTSSPTWQRARAVLQAGAVDYPRKSLDEKEIRSVIKSVLELPPPGARQ